MNEHDDQYWNRQGCFIIVGLSLILWALIISFGVWFYRYGLNSD